MNTHHIEFDISFKTNPYPGKLIAIEGIDGSGKTTQAHNVVAQLTKNGVKALYTKEPTDEPTGKLIRLALAGEVKMPPIALQYLYGADRAVHLEQVEEYLRDGQTVVTDRYFWSSVAYAISDLTPSGVLGASNPDDYYLTAFSILSHYHQFILPDYTFFLDIHPKDAMTRIDEVEKEKEIYEERGKLSKIEHGYRWLMDRFPDAFISIDGTRSIENVTESILSRISL